MLRPMPGRWQALTLRTLKADLTRSMVPWLQDPQEPFPPTAKALGQDSDAPGLLAAGGELTLWRLREAYSRGIFPWYGPGQPVLWWSPDPRMVLQTAHFKLSRSLRKTVARFARTPGCEIRVDRDPADTMRCCAGAQREGQNGTWIVPEMLEAYTGWNCVHGIETWVDGELAGGLYGISLGRMFFGESMFSRRSDGSKIALAALICLCREMSISWIDCQQNTKHLASMGAFEVTRDAFERHLAESVPQPAPQHWAFEPSLWQHLGLKSSD